MPRPQKEVPWICLLHLSHELLLFPSRSTSLVYVPVCLHECWFCNNVITFACDKRFGLVDIGHETCCCGVTIVISTHLVLPEYPIFCAIVKQRNSDDCYWFVSPPVPSTHTLLLVPHHLTPLISRSSSLWTNCSNVQHVLCWQSRWGPTAMRKGALIGSWWGIVCSLIVGIQGEWKWLIPN